MIIIIIIIIITIVLVMIIIIMIIVNWMYSHQSVLTNDTFHPPSVTHFEFTSRQPFLSKNTIGQICDLIMGGTVYWPRSSCTVCLHVSVWSLLRFKCCFYFVLTSLSKCLCSQPSSSLLSTLSPLLFSSLNFLSPFFFFKLSLFSFFLL